VAAAPQSTAGTVAPGLRDRRHPVRRSSATTRRVRAAGTADTPAGRGRPGGQFAHVVHLTRLRGVNLMNTLAPVAAAAAVLAVAAPAASADTTPAPSCVAQPMLTFVPPHVGPITVVIGPTILGGKLMDPGLRVVMPGVSMPPLVWGPISCAPRR
jgi:hypothetical protein